MIDRRASALASVSLIAVAAVFTACHEGSDAAGPTSAPAAAPSSFLPDASNATVSSFDAGAPNDAAVPASPLAVATSASDASPPPTYFSPNDWAEAHHASRATELLDTPGDCHATRLGDPARDVMWCERSGPIEVKPAGESIYALTVIDVDAHGELHLLFRIPFAAGFLDPPRPKRPDEWRDVNFVNLQAEASDDGQTIHVHDRAEAGETCAARRAKYQHDPNLDAGQRASVLTQIDKACGARGTYIWKSGRFVRKR